MEKRTFLKTGLLLTFSTALAPLIGACKSVLKAADTPAPPTPVPPVTGNFTLPPLPYALEALEPHIDKLTMEIHHDRHHLAYVNNLNDAVKETMYADMSLEDILIRVSNRDNDKKVRNNAGGHWNHSMFWQIMSPTGGGTPSGTLAEAINAAFGTFDEFKNQFTTAAKSVFGSGWAWLCVGDDKKLFITSTPNQDNPLMIQFAAKTGTPILCLDVWEHAYYLKYQNKRPDYITAFYNVINWKEVEARYVGAIK